MVLLALIAGVGTGGLRPSTFAERLAGIVDDEQLGRVVQAVGDGDVARTSDELAALAGSVVGRAAEVAEEVVAASADELPRPVDAPPLCPLPALGTAESPVDLDRHEGWGGHTIRDHVGQTDEQMRQRLAPDPLHPPAVSTFEDKAWATRVVSAAHACVEPAFTAWRAGPLNHRSLECTVDFGQPVGRRLTRDLTQPVLVEGVTVVYRLVQHSQIGYRISTAYPDVGAQAFPCLVR